MARSISICIWLSILGLFATTYPNAAAAATPQIRAGLDYVVRLMPDGVVWEWGVTGYGCACSSSSGTCYNGNTYDATPVPVSGLSSVESVAAAGSVTIARTTNGTVWAFGRGPQVPVDCTQAHGSIQPKMSVWQIMDPSDPSKPLANVTAIWASQWAASGSYFAQKADGTVWAWGDNTTDKLGGNPPGKTKKTTNPPPDVATIATPIQVRRGVSSPDAIASGHSHTLALSASGSILAWGGDAYGERGDGSYNHSSFPYWNGHVWFDQATSSSIAGVTAVAAGAYKSMALKNDGTVWGWGQNTNGELGSKIPLGGNTDGSNTPVQVAGISGAAAIALGSHHSVVLLGNGTVWAMGYNGDFVLGAPASVTWSTTPLQVPSLVSVKAIDAAGECSVALKSDGTVWEWGHCPDGHLGATPWQVPGSPCSKTPSNYGQSCGSCGTVTCAGTCSAPTPSNYGAGCGSCGGTITCAGTCSVATPSNYGAHCGKCGAINCSGACVDSPPSKYGSYCSWLESWEPGKYCHGYIHCNGNCAVDDPYECGYSTP